MNHLKVDAIDIKIDIKMLLTIEITDVCKCYNKIVKCMIVTKFVWCMSVTKLFLSMCVTLWVHEFSVCKCKWVFCVYVASHRWEC